MALSLGYFPDPFDQISRAVDRSFDNFFGRSGMDLLGLPRTARGGRGGQLQGGGDLGLGLIPWSSLAGTHPMDVTEHNDRFEVHADAPGFAPEDIKVELSEGVLTISGTKHEAKEEKNQQGQVWRRERTERRFSRAFVLPQSAAHENISAKLENGVLTVTVPKLPEAPKPQPMRITVGSGSSQQRLTAGSPSTAAGANESAGAGTA